MTTTSAKVEIKTITVTAPSHWASYLINGDFSVFSYSDNAEDEQACYDMEKKIGGHCVDAEDIGFVPFPDYGGKGADCSRYTFQVK